MDKQIELAKSWFVLAQILMTLAGFLIATYGFSVAFQSSILASSLSALIKDENIQKIELKSSQEICLF